MSAWYVWTKRDLGRSGWDWDASTSSPTIPALDDVASRWASPRAFAQLEPSSRVSTAGIPIVSAVWDAAANRWVVVLRGVGGMFRGAGATQVALAPVGDGLQRAWPAFFAAVGPEGIADLNALTAGSLPFPASVPQNKVDEVLHLLAEDATVTTLDVDPVDTIDLYAAVLRIIPETAARRVCWSTCHLPTEISSNDRIITGRWPAHLAEAWPHVLNRLLVIRSHTSPTLAAAPGAGRRRTLAWLSRQGANSDLLLDARAASVADFLAEADARRPITVDEVLEELDAGAPAAAVADRLIANPGVARQLVGQYPAAAEPLLDALGAGHPLRRMLLGPLVLDPQSDSGNQIRIQLRDEALTGKPRPIGDEIAACVTAGEFARVADLALADLKGNDEDLIRVEPWLRHYGVTRVDAPDLFTFDIRPILKHVELGEFNDAAGNLGQGPKRLERAALVVAALGLDAPNLPAFLKATLGKRPDRYAIPYLFDRVGSPTPGTASALVNELSALTGGDAATPEARQDLTAGLVSWLGRRGLIGNDPLAGALISLATGYDLQVLIGSISAKSSPAPGREPDVDAKQDEPDDDQTKTKPWDAITAFASQVFHRPRKNGNDDEPMSPSGTSGSYPPPKKAELVLQADDAGDPARQQNTSLVPWLLSAAAFVVFFVVMIAIAMTFFAGGAK